MRNLKNTLESDMKQKSKSVAKPSSRVSNDGRDARVLETRKRIDAAFVQLLFRRSYKSLRVSDITKKAGIGRATFYAHFSSKDELLKSQVIRVIVPMLHAFPESASLLDCRSFFAHVREAPQLFRAIMSGGEGSGSRVVREAMEERLDVLMRGTGRVTGTVPSLLVKRFVISTLLTIVSCGLQPNAAESGDEMQIQFEKLVGSGLSDQLAR
jgi:AcrR family transcriptional regulator